MRKLNTGDVLFLFRIIKKGKLKHLIAEIENLGDSNKDQEVNKSKMAAEVAIILFEILGIVEVQEDVIELLAGIKGIKPDEFIKQSPAVTIADLKQIVEENDIVSFFKSAGLFPLKL